jgi:hypothetical protein
VSRSWSKLGGLSAAARVKANAATAAKRKSGHDGPCHPGENSEPLLRVNATATITRATFGIEILDALD